MILEFVFGREFGELVVFIKEEDGVIILLIGENFGIFFGLVYIFNCLLKCIYLELLGFDNRFIVFCIRMGF